MVSEKQFPHKISFAVLETQSKLAWIKIIDPVTIAKYHASEAILKIDFSNIGPVDYAVREEFVAKV